MHRQPFKKIRFHLIATPTGAIESRDVPSESDLAWVQLPTDPMIGVGGICRLNLSLGMTLSLAKIQFTDKALGQMITLTETEAQFSEPSFQVVVTRNLRGIFDEANPVLSLAISQGMDLFRYAQQYRSKISVDGSFSGEFHLLSVSRSVLDSLIGHELAEQLLQKVGISKHPVSKVIPIPQYISNHLVRAISPSMVDDSRKLFAQAKSLEFLAALVDHLCYPKDSNVDFDNHEIQRARNVHDELLALSGKLPTLDELAERHGRSAKLLNEAFVSEYGESIYSFITNHRLQHAHERISKTNVSIKTISAELGYSHVSNFSIAFKRKFGYPPGSLRKVREN